MNNNTATAPADTSTCTICAGQHYPCSTGRRWACHVGPCLACGRETRNSAGCGHPHCADCREPADQLDNETEQQGMARTYSLIGWKIFPLWWIENGICACRAGGECTSPGKHPRFKPAHTKGEPKCFGACGKTGHGLYDATADADTVARWWTDNPKAGIGLPAHGNGFVVLDVDSKSGGLDSIDRLGARCRTRGIDLDDTLTQSTGQYPAGRGFHLVFQAPPDGIKGGAKNFGPEYPGLDIRGRGHYIVVAPTLHFSGVQYEWLDFFATVAPWPDLLTNYLAAKVPTPPAVPTAPTGARPTGNGYAATALANEVAEVRATPEGGRNNRLNKAAWNLGQLVAVGKLDRAEVERELLAAALAIGLAHSAAENTIESGLNNGIANPRRERAA